MGSAAPPPLVSGDDGRRTPLNPGAALEAKALRADALADPPGASTEVLRFASGLYRAQALAATALTGQAPLTGRLSEDSARIFAMARGLLGFLSSRAPEGLAEQARLREHEDPPLFASRLDAFWQGGLESSEDYVSRCLLRPYAEVLRSLGCPPERPRAEGSCPFCGGKPWISSRKPAADGSARLLGCSLCGGEWPFGRVLCPCCFEQDPQKLPSFQADRYPAARIEACETCRRYVKSIDLTVDGRAEPEVDDVLSWSLDLWAVEEGFRRLEPGLVA